MSRVSAKGSTVAVATRAYGTHVFAVDALGALSETRLVEHVLGDVRVEDVVVGEGRGVIVADTSPPRSRVTATLRQFDVREAMIAEDASIEVDIAACPGSLQLAAHGRWTALLCEAKVMVYESKGGGIQWAADVPLGVGTVGRSIASDDAGIVIGTDTGAVVRIEASTGWTPRHLFATRAAAEVDAVTAAGDCYVTLERAIATGPSTMVAYCASDGGALTGAVVGTSGIWGSGSTVSSDGRSVLAADGRGGAVHVSELFATAWRIHLPIGFRGRD